MRILPCLLVLIVLAGCSKNPPAPETSYPAHAGAMEKVSLAAADGAQSRGGAEETPGQKIIRNGQLTVEVADLDSADAAVRAAVTRQGGRVESANRYKDEQIHLRIRVPAGGLDGAIAHSSALGRVISRSLSENDVSTNYIDTQARLKTRLALRDRLEALLDTAKSVEEVLNIERELARVQGEIDSMQGRLNYLDRQVAESTLDLTLQTPGITPPEQKPGPLGYVFVGLFKAVKWLFVWED